MSESKINSGDLVGKVLLGYELTELVTTGGSSEVYRAKPKNLENKKVVIKVAKRAHTKYNEDLEVLAKKLDRFNHPNIVGILNSGEYEGRNFLVLDSMNGSFADTMNKWNEPQSDYKPLVKVAVEALKGLEEAHDKEVIHTDITPGNILTGRNGTVKIADFFSPEVYAEQEGKTDDLSSLKSVKEKKEGDVVDARKKYLAPEQKDLIDAPVDGRTDIYSLGVVLYEALMGNIPFGNYDKLSEKHEKIPKWFEKAIEKSLAGHPNKRWKSAKVMKEYLEQGLEGKLDEPSLFNKAITKFSKAITKTKEGISEIYDTVCDNTKEIAIGFGILAAVGGIGALIYAADYVIDKRNEVLEAFKTKKGIIAYSVDNKVGLLTPSEVTGDQKTEYITPATDLVEVRWRNDGKKLLLTDEPKLRGDCGEENTPDTALYVLDLDTKKTNKILDITEGSSTQHNNIKEAYWSKSDENKVYVLIDYSWYSLDTTKGADQTKEPLLKGRAAPMNPRKPDLSDVDRSPQNSSLDKKITVKSVHDQFVITSTHTTWAKHPDIDAEGLAWYHPKPEKSEEVKK